MLAMHQRGDDSYYFPNMTKKPKQEPIKPDEVFNQGPLRGARYGNNIVFESNWPQDSFAEMQQRLVATYLEIVKEINGLVEAIGSLPIGHCLARF